MVGENFNHGEKVLLVRSNFIDLHESYIVLNKPKLINSRTAFVSTVIVIPVLTLIVYLSGLQSHRSLYLNSLISTTILSLTFFIFITTGLYNGWKLKDGYGNFIDKFSYLKQPDSPTMNMSDLDADILNPIGCIGILVWIILALAGSLIFWAIGAMVWATILVIAGILYWIIFRAYRLIFLNSPRCKNNLSKSMGIALIYTILYNCWILPSFLVLITYKLNLSNVPLFFAFAGVIACKLYFSCCLYDSNNGWRKLQPRRKTTLLAATIVS